MKRFHLSEDHDAMTNDVKPFADRVTNDGSGGVLENEGKESSQNANTRNDDEGDDDIICEEEESADILTSISATSRVVCSDASGESYCRGHSPSSLTGDHINVKFGGKVAPVTASILPYSDKEWIFSEIFSHPKLEAVKQICDAESVADKNSVPSKILNSLLYDFAKSAAVKCPFRNVDDTRCKQFYAKCFEEIWNEFLPNLRELDERDLAGKRMSTTMTAAGRDRSIRTCCRDLFRRNFFTLVRRQNKRDSRLFDQF